MIAALIIALWLLVCGLLLLANHAFKLSRDQFERQFPNDCPHKSGIGSGNAFTHHEDASA